MAPSALAPKLLAAKGNTRVDGPPAKADADDLVRLGLLGLAATLAPKLRAAKGITAAGVAGPPAKDGVDGPPAKAGVDVPPAKAGVDDPAVAKVSARRIVKKSAMDNLRPVGPPMPLHPQPVLEVLESAAPGGFGMVSKAKAAAHAHSPCVGVVPAPKTPQLRGPPAKRSIGEVDDPPRVDLTGGPDDEGMESAGDESSEEEELATNADEVAETNAAGPSSSAAAAPAQEGADGPSSSAAAAPASNPATEQAEESEGDKEGPASEKEDPESGNDLEAPEVAVALVRVDCYICKNKAAIGECTLVNKARAAAGSRPIYRCAACNRFNSGLNKILRADATLKEQYGMLTPEETSEFMLDHKERYGSSVTAAGLRMDLQEKLSVLTRRKLASSDESFLQADYTWYDSDDLDLEFAAKPRRKENIKNNAPQLVCDVQMCTLYGVPKYHARAKQMMLRHDESEVVRSSVGEAGPAAKTPALKKAKAQAVVKVQAASAPKKAKAAPKPVFTKPQMKIYKSLGRQSASLTEKQAVIERQTKEEKFEPFLAKDFVMRVALSRTTLTEISSSLAMMAEPGFCGRVDEELQINNDKIGKLNSQCCFQEMVLWQAAQDLRNGEDSVTEGRRSA